MTGVCVVKSLTKATNVECVTSIISTLEKNTNLDLSQFPLEEVDDNEVYGLGIHSCFSRGHWAVI
jgi:hypothetical protein